MYAEELLDPNTPVPHLDGMGIEVPLTEVRDTDDPFEHALSQTSRATRDLRRRQSSPQFVLQPASPSEWQRSENTGSEGDQVSLVVSSGGNGKGKAKGKGKGRARKRLGLIVGNFSFRRRKTITSKALTPPSTPPSRTQFSSPAFESFLDPFSDENAMDYEHKENNLHSLVQQHGSPSYDEGIGSGFPLTGAVLPRTPRKNASSSVPTTPQSTPPSVRSTRSKLTLTPASAKSWLSDLSTSSGHSTMSTMRRQRAKRTARVASQMKSIQLLGIEAAGAIAAANKVPEMALQLRPARRSM